MPVRGLRTLAWGAVLLNAVAPAGAKSKGKEKDLGGGWNEKTKDDGRVVQELKIEAPTMTEEDQYGYVMPERYKCDSCKAVMFHLDKDIKIKHPKSRRMKQWEYTDLFDDSCRTSFEGYGIKLVNGQNALSGPGLKQADALAPGSGAIQMGGESWTKRLGEICRKIVYEKIGEDQLYDFYKEDGSISEELCTSETHDCRAPGAEKPPVPPAAPKPKAKKEKKAVKKDSRQEKPPKVVDATSGAKASATASPGRPAGGASGAEPVVDVQSFLRSLAVRHGLMSDEYLGARTAREWEKLTVSIAGRIFNRHADSEL